VAATGSEAAATPRRPHGTLRAFYGEDAQREGFVVDLFDRTARAYDRVCALLSLGAGRGHRRRALARLGVGPGTALLDVATGTGQLAAEALALGVGGHELCGLDPSAGMLAAHAARGRTLLVRGVGERLPFADATFDCLTMGYALRHVADLDVAFREFLRVLRPGGRALVMEITRPTSKLGTALLRTHLTRVVPALAWATGRHREARDLMGYYWATIEGCVPPKTIREALQGAGFTDVEHRVTAGLLSDWSAQRPR
jgi:demethylmenaquinone methyltransferase/2-methoxy-6-polyprenyl-1,4-benzoquinol methylase